MLLRCLCIAVVIVGSSCPLALAEDPTIECAPIDGIETLLKPGRVLLLGELHGTVESPEFAGDVACHAVGAGLDVVAGLELLAGSRPDSDTFDREALLSGRQWQSGYQDGRTSRAMLDLIEEVGGLRRADRSVSIVFFDAQPPGGGQARERAMAANLASSVEASPEAMHIVLTGNLHSRVTKGSWRSPDYEPMGYLLSNTVGEERVTSLDVSHSGGSAWVCAPDCGVARLRGHGSEARWKIEIDDETRPAGHDGWYGVGKITASTPAVGHDEDEPVAAVPDVAPAPPPPEPDEPFLGQTAEMLRPFQGSWQAYQYDSKAWTIEIREERFRGVLGPDDWYEGKIRLRPESDPAQIDFMIESCRCNYRGMTSQGIYRMADETVLLSASQPGHPRPTGFDKNDGRMVELRRK